ncbi:MAG: hypothetical protein HKN11_08270 [Rhizobiales bacterium]|nr:hypothetical protein [Hyphomicrobiales bacterium]
MTVKTLLIAIGLILGFAGFMSLAWNISAVMMGTPVVEVEPAPQKAPPVEKIQTDVPDQSDNAEVDPVQDTEADVNQPAQAGAYDDKWTGSEETKSDAGLKPSGQTEPKSASPVTVDPVVDPYAPDDRETVDKSDQTDSTPSPLQKADPYKGDDREAQ